ncbi:MAG TPA: DUF58 domain-containing protein [Polyangiaceae bacterium]|nr:DUF58 domain-containing protein [Polyangiaceae bacterium]
MRLHPTRATFHVALAGAAVTSMGVALRLGPVVAFGGAMILAVAVGRAFALSAVTRLRAAGFEMVWSTSKRVLRVARGETVTFGAELRNRSGDEMRGISLRAIASSMLEARVEPETVDLMPHARLEVKVTVLAKRVGRWGVHGMALEIRGIPAGGEALYEVPLMFANPFGIEVFPRALHALLTSPRGGRSRRAAEAGRAAPALGEGDEIRELRDHVPGDPFKRIAWKASARRGRLIVRDMDREERDVVWLVLDASVELWAGSEGRAPLDDMVDEVAALAARHIARGDRVGLAVLASRPRTWLAPASGAPHAVKIAAALASAAGMVDADRCELDEWEIAQRVAEHARPLDPRGLHDIPKSNLDLLAARAQALRARAPFAPRVPFAQSTREQQLRHYIAAFGIEVPPRVEGERDKTHVTMAGALEMILNDKKVRASVMYVFSPAPAPTSEILTMLRRLRANRVDVRWSIPAFERSVTAPEKGTTPTRVQEVVDEAVWLRAIAARARSEKILRRLGVRARITERRIVG